MIDVLFFAELQEIVGNEKVSVEADGMTVTDLKNNLLSTYNLDNLNNAMVAINQEYAQSDATLKKGDVVAFIPPVSGG
ncbi:molybdopterin converting factor subunit 1 [Virgibacillus litoralis]|uniref:Molybdopterin synthase sulfur carrier subunit n=1 Tax=Virgibacillus litoralis TaxID=578221 RepID=A0ABS4H8M9_9BACI|nr:molybdopterin converting factor subunit 1 [Virgibacillus litoralis]MBP1947261.1 molybdopterin synthase sulfur carrier subunit [Virgibacillus litoralis]